VCGRLIFHMEKRCFRFCLRSLSWRTRCHCGSMRSEFVWPSGRDRATYWAWSEQGVDADFGRGRTGLANQLRADPLSGQPSMGRVMRLFPAERLMGRHTESESIRAGSRGASDRREHEQRSIVAESWIWLMLFLVPSVGLKLFFCTANFVPFLYRRPGKVAFLALLAFIEFNNLPRINQVNSSTPAASTIIEPVFSVTCKIACPSDQ